MPTTEDVYEFEGDTVSDFLLAVPGIKVESDMAYPRGTHLNVTAEFRVRSVRIEEDRKGNITRHHVLAPESFSVKSAITPDQRRAQYEAEEAALAAQQAEAEQTGVIQEHPGAEDVEGWEDMTEEQRVEARRKAVEDGDEPIAGTNITVGEVEQEEFVDATAVQETPDGVVEADVAEDADQYDPVNF